jgi:hypothetical protein
VDATDFRDGTRFSGSNSAGRIFLNMPKRQHKKLATTAESHSLKGWQQIAAFLGHPAATVQRWASEGMPVKREGRFVVTTPEDLNAWLGKQSGKPVHVATENTDLAAELRRGLSFLRDNKTAKSQPRKPKRR